jgi:hypothetical protein
MKTIILILSLFSFSSFAQWRHENYFSFPTSTQDGKISITSQASLAPGVKWVRIYVVGNGKIDDNYFPIQPGESFEHTISLRYGPGSYTYQIMTSKNDDKHDQYSYAIEHGGTFTNSASDELDTIAPSCDVQSDLAEIITLAEKITQGLQTEMEKTKAIHDWVASHIAYDVDSYFQNTYAQKNWDALTVLHSGQAICQGYSNLTAALNRAVGIRARVLRGSADVYSVGWSDHAWNEVYADGRWISQDTTWDAGGVNWQTKKFQFSLKEKYFDPKAEAFAVDHRPLP